jgi:hypothetical protein
MAHAGGVNVKLPRLRILEKSAGDARRERIGVGDDRFGVIRILCPLALCDASAIGDEDIEAERALMAT